MPKVLKRMRILLKGVSADQVESWLLVGEHKLMTREKVIVQVGGLKCKALVQQSRAYGLTPQGEHSYYDIELLVIHSKKRNKVVKNALERRQGQKVQII